MKDINNDYELHNRQLQLKTRTIDIIIDDDRKK